MSPEAQRIAIATACGYHRNPATGMWDNGNPRLSRLTFRLPDYLNSLDAMAEAENQLTTTNQQNLYQSNIAEICWGDEERGDNQVVFNQLTANASKRAEAFLRALNLWTS